MENPLVKAQRSTRARRLRATWVASLKAGRTVLYAACALGCASGLALTMPSGAYAASAPAAGASAATAAAPVTAAGPAIAPT
ncbi:hypothetical protein CIC12_14180, partial [Burkholderia sp. SG-MS1]|nr:hypothetical protein [Paraburkholderia sp. SG-MS1]